MSRIPYVTRIDGRYRYRRRVHYRNICSLPVTLALKTADPDEARTRSALLSARFVKLAKGLKRMFEGGDFLTADEIAALVQNELRQELERAVGHIQTTDDPAAAIRQSRIFAEAYRIARRLDRPHELTPDDEAELTDRGFSAMEVQFIACDLDRICASKNLAAGDVAERLDRIDAYASAKTVEQARAAILGARADAHRRAALLTHPDLIDLGNPLEALIHFDEARLDRGKAGISAPAAGVSTDQGQFLIYDKRRFADVIEEVVAELRQEGRWKGVCAQQRAIMHRFAWITGNKEIGCYTHMDVAAFKRGLQRLPKDFGRTGSASPTMRPFDEVVAQLPPLKRGQARNPKTVNRDLSTMSTVAKHLAQTGWMPRVPNATVLDFAGATIPIKDDGHDTRPPWTEAHMKALFSSPIYLGGGGVGKRLRETATPKVWHDAAYFAPLVWYYTHAAREEICGLRADEVIIDHDVPHFIIQNNDVRGVGDEKAGEKRIARRRPLPLHPELIRLGLLDYVRAVRQEGHVALFPELYLFEGKRGGQQFYSRAWVHIFHWLEDRMSIPRNEQGKGPDIHSIRALGSSFYERDGVNEIIRADIMGHARTGTNAKHYSKRLAAEGLDIMLGEWLAFITRYVPIVTDQVPASPVRLLPVKDRSRVGTGRHRKVRFDCVRGKIE